MHIGELISLDGFSFIIHSIWVRLNYIKIKPKNIQLYLNLTKKDEDIILLPTWYSKNNLKFLKLCNLICLMYPISEQNRERVNFSVTFQTDAVPRKPFDSFHFFSWDYPQRLSFYHSQNANNCITATHKILY